MMNMPEILAKTKQLSLLYVEDNDEVRKYTSDLLKKFFGNVAIATDGMEGLASFEREKADLIITDINLPKMSGLEMVGEIRSKDREIMIIVLSAFNEHDYIAAAEQLGINGYMTKPLTLQQLVAKLTSLLAAE